MKKMNKIKYKFEVDIYIYILIQIVFTYLILLYKDEIILKYTNFLIILIIFYFLPYFHNKTKYKRTLFLTFFFTNGSWNQIWPEIQTLFTIKLRARCLRGFPKYSTAKNG